MTRKTFTVPDGYEAVRDADGRATGEVRPAQSSAGIEEPHDLPFHKETMAGLDALTIRSPVTSLEDKQVKEALHYLGAIKVRLELLYEHSTQDARLLEHLSDEVDWVDAEIDRLRSGGAAQRQPETSDEEVERIAKWLHDETAHPESYPNHTWPETERDDGQREGGFVKIVPQHGQAYFRDIARRLLTQIAPQSLDPAYAPPISMDDIVATIASEWGSHLCYSKCARSVPSIQKCRCFDIANALAAEYDIKPKASSLPSTSQNTPPDWKQDQAETSRKAPQRPISK
jgi:hypothetical protein